MTHKELIARAEKWLMNTKGCSFCFTELTCWAPEVPDAIGWKSCHSHLVECKTSRADFQSDAKKMVRQFPYLGMGVYRYYMTVHKLITPEELPRQWGLLYVYKNQVRMIKDPISFKVSDATVQEMPLLMSALRRVYLRGDLPKIYDSVWKTTPAGDG